MIVISLLAALGQDSLAIGNVMKKKRQYAWANTIFLAVGTILLMR